MGTQITCASLEKYQVLIRARSHAWIADEPPPVGGDDLGPTPFELLLASLGACTTITVAHYAGQAKIPLEQLRLDISGDEDKEKGYRIRMTLCVRGDLSEKDLERLRRAADRCPVHGILSKGAAIETGIQRD